MAKKSGKGFGTRNSKERLGVTLTATAMERLAQMARKTGLSKSELVDRLVPGEMETPSQVEGKQESADRLRAELASTSNQLQESDRHLAQLQARVSELQTQFARSVEQCQTLEGQLQERETEIARLQGEIEREQQQRHRLEQIGHQQQQRLDRLEAHTRDQQGEQSATIAQLQEQLEHQRSAHQSSISEVEQHPQQLEAYRNLQQEGDRLRQRIEELETIVTQQASQSDRHLQEELQQKSHLIAELRQQLADCQRLATIGERQLNKWRS